MTLVEIEAGPLEVAGKDVTAVVKSRDEKLVAVGVMAGKVKAQCKGCPSVRGYTEHTQFLFRNDVYFHRCTL